MTVLILFQLWNVSSVAEHFLKSAIFHFHCSPEFTICNNIMIYMYYSNSHIYV